MSLIVIEHDDDDDDDDGDDDDVAPVIDNGNNKKLNLILYSLSLSLCVQMCVHKLLTSDDEFFRLSTQEFPTTDE